MKPFERYRLVGSGFEVFHQGIQVLFEIILEHFNDHLVRACRTPIPLDGLKGLPHRLGGNSPRQRVDFEFRARSSRRILLTLALPVANA
jgi:hypothetical protein